MPAGPKSEAALRTIGEVADDLGVPQHILRYWETRFTQLRPLTRAGNRRYYRPADIALVRRIHTALSQQGYTVKGVQKLLGEPEVATATTALSPAAPPDVGPVIADLQRIRAMLAEALRSAD